MKYQAIGDICLIKKKDKKLAKKILKDFPQFKTVCYQGKISGKLRKPNIKVLAGDGTETIHADSGCRFKLDVAKIMWSKGNHFERQRMMNIVRKNDVIIDCFSGIGYWSIPVASRVKQVYAIELNPVSFNYLEESIRLNRLSNIIAIKGDCSKVIPAVKADRIIMGLLPSAKKYIPTALKHIKKGGIIHYHGIAREGKELLKDFKGKKVKLLKITNVKSYSPGIYHFVLDLKVLKIPSAK